MYIHIHTYTSFRESWQSNWLLFLHPKTFPTKIPGIALRLAKMFQWELIKS